MKQKLLTTFITLVLVLIMPVTLLCWVFLIPSQYGDTFMGELKHKVQLLCETEGKRIILVGGSSVAFGIDSTLLEQHFPEYRVINFGMYAALGTTVMLDLSEPYIREGDIVILMPEQQAQTLSDYFDASVMWQGVDGACELLLSLTPEQQGMMLGYFPGFAAQKFAWGLRGDMLQPEGVYRRDSFNRHGDVVSEICSQNVMPGGFDTNTPIRFDPAIVTGEFIERVNAYAAAVTEKGAILWYGFCPMNASALETGSDVDAFYDALQAQLTFPILGNPHNSILDAGWFYDTNFHLNASGKTVYTRNLIRSIKAMLLDSSPTQIAIPPIPELSESELWLGDDSHWEYFLFEETNGSVTIVGVTGSGAQQQSLTVPSTWNGMAVTSIATNAFSNCENLKTVTIQKNIRTIVDGAFSGCGALERIVMESTKPSDCTVGPGLLDGTNANIHVIPDVLSTYRTDYFWSVHAQHILPQEPF